MCTDGCIEFAAAELSAGVVTGRSVLEVGSFDVNGNVRYLAKSQSAGSYIGVDIAEGPGVDVVCEAADLVAQFGPASFDVVVTTEMLEHVDDWKCAVGQMKAVLKPQGRLILTTRSPGFQLHGFPADYWRFTENDMRAVFADLDDLIVRSDSPASPGVFVAGTKSSRPAIPLDAMAIYCMVTRTRRVAATRADIAVSTALVTAKRYAPATLRTTGRRALSAVIRRV